jgi:hypothetical protein
MIRQLIRKRPQRWPIGWPPNIIANPATRAPPLPPARADGWEFRWRYRPCPEFASLRVWISRNGRRASYAEFPDCAPVTGLPADPRKT